MIDIIELDIKTEKMITGPTPTEEEVQKLYSLKADKAEFESLKAEFLRLEGIVDQLEGDYSNEDSYDEYDDEDSQVEDVISLGEGGSGGKEDDDEEFFEGDDEETKKLADKAKELTQKTLKQGGALDPTKKVSEEKGKEEEESKGPKRKCTEDEQVNNKELNKDIQEADKKSEMHEKKSLASTANIDWNETTNSMGMTIGTINNGNSRAPALKKQETIKSKKRGLSRMSSKMSISTRKRGGGGRGGADSKDVEELKLNMTKVLEDIRKLKNFEHDSETTFRRFESTLVDLKKKNDIFVSQHNLITKKQEEIEWEHIKAMEISSQRTKKVIQIYNEIKSLIDDFKTEYRYGFKKIIKAEVDINVLNQQLRFVKTKIKPKEEEKLNKDDLIREVDAKFEVLYSQISDMASEQANFNSLLQREQENLKDPIEAEISRIREESNIMMRELERTQKNNREIIVHKMTSGLNEDRSPDKLNNWLNYSTGFNKALKK